MSSIHRPTDHPILPAFTVTFTLLLAAILCGPAMAARNAGGAMVLHVDNSVSYSAEWDYCSSDPLPPTCEELVTTVTKDPEVEALVWMVAAFASNSSPGVTAFQVGVSGDIPAERYAAHAPCAMLEIPDDGWPAPGTGTACAFLSPVYDRLFKMYWFAVTAPGIGSTLSTTDYPGGDHHAEWADDYEPAHIDYCTRFGRVVWGGDGQNQCPGEIRSGACCFPDGSCQVLLQSDCVGQYMGDDTVCDPNPCPPPIGACCISGNCTNLTELECEAQGGAWEGYGTDCISFQCPPPVIGACCFPDHHCEQLTQTECAQQGGSYGGNWTFCNPNPCAGACCFADGHCEELSRTECQQAGGSYQADGIPCAPNPCAQPGACCFADGHCSVLLQGQCHQQGGYFQGGGTTCDPNPCSQPGACCFADGSCSLLIEPLCQEQYGIYQGAGTTCDPNPCTPRTGACCFADEHCEILTQVECAQQNGIYRGDQSSCEPNPCTQTGACCFADGHCAVLNVALCHQQGGVYQGDDTICDPNPCCPHAQERAWDTARPIPSAPGGGVRNVIAPTRTACWSEPSDLNGLIASSEQILAFGLETEVANDFVPTGALTHATWWGGFYNNSTPCVPCIATPGFNLRFFEDAGCVPGTIIADLSITTFTQEEIGCQSGAYPMYKWGTDVSLGTTAGHLYWFDAQMKDHAFPPQAGRLAAGSITGCESMFRSVYFGYPNWTGVIDVFGVAFDASQEFECGGSTPTVRTTWGRIKGMYR